ncbi:MAG: permease, partial [Deltaproteobacteria bacterium]|nr:permease [Deltaproteobacteria bacterium]
MEATFTSSSAVGVARRRQLLIGIGTLLIIAVIGLFLVKWSPYFNRAFV